MDAQHERGDHPVLRSCRDLGAAMDRFDEAACAALRVGRSDLRALNLLGDGALTPTALARELGLTRPAVTALVDRLVTAGFVARVAVPGDRRATAVAVQAATGEAFARLYGPLGERVRTAVAALPAPERAALAPALAALAGAFRAACSDLADDPPGEVARPTPEGAR
jgi:DNA-binding MarR family transcriptional regulator